MVKIAGLWELSYNTPLVEHDQWSFFLKDFGVDEWAMAPVSGIRHKGSLLHEYDQVIDIIEDNLDLTVVYIDEAGKTNLEDFEHPLDALYICGRANFSPYKSIGGGQSVRIRTPNNTGGLWPHQALAIVLYDRIRKNKWQLQ